MAKRILVLDDDIGVLEAIETALQYEGFIVKTMGRTYNIFKDVKEFNPDVIIVDYILDGMNGAELCRRIKTNSETRHLPVIIISAHQPTVDLVRTFGCDQFISKPFGLAELQQGIKKVLNKSKLAID